MTKVADQDKTAFFADVDAYARKATWCALATVADNEPRVRMVHPTWEGDVLWFATGPETAKAQQIAANPVVDVQFQVSPPEFVHLMVRGHASLITDDDVREHVWNKVMDYDLADFWPAGPKDPGYVAVRIDPDRVELSEMFGSVNKRVWRR